MEQTTQSTEKEVFLNNQRITEVELKKEQEKSNVRIIQEDENHFRKLERMNG